jgi:hypothetical protein
MQLCGDQWWELAFRCDPYSLTQNWFFLEDQSHEQLVMLWSKRPSNLVPIARWRLLDKFFGPSSQALSPCSKRLSFQTVNPFPTFFGILAIFHSPNFPTINLTPQCSLSISFAAWAIWPVPFIVWLEVGKLLGMGDGKLLERICGWIWLATPILPISVNHTDNLLHFYLWQ